MKTILSSRRRHYLVRVSIFLIAVALIAAMVGCAPDRYSLTISSTEGGEVDEPGEGTYMCDKGNVVDLVAEAKEGYQFVNWTGDVDTIADENDAVTKITMNGDYTITANFTVEILKIRTWDNLDSVRDKPGGNCVLMNDLDFKNASLGEWVPIEDFYGIFDGQNYTIMGLFIDRPYEDNVGLFGSITDKAVIKNVKLVNVTVTGNKNVGGLVGKNSGTVSNSYSTGSVTGDENVGGLVGSNQGTVENSHSSGSVTGKERVGGLVGSNQGTEENGGTVSNSYSTGSVTGKVGVGGLVGRNDDGTVSNSHYNYDEVYINDKQRVITIGALSDEDFDLWSKNKLDVNKRLSEKDEKGYYLVSNVTAFKQLLAFGQDDLKFRLTKDLYLGDDEHNFYIPYFVGEFDGWFDERRHTISNLSLDLGFVCNVGLFGYLAPGGSVTQVGVEDVDIIGASSVGGLVGDNNGIVNNSDSSGAVRGDKDVGGLVGHNYMQSQVRNSYSTGSVTGYNYVGGLVGHNQGTVEKSNSTVSVNPTLKNYGEVVGGLVGFNNINSRVSKSHSTGSVTGYNYVGGLVGRNQGTVSESYSTGSVTSEKGSYIGGLVGSNGELGTVSNSYSWGSVNGYSCVGGLVGYNSNPGTLMYNVIDSYSTGSVSGNLYVGGLVGRNYGNARDSFWDNENSHMTAGVGTGNDAQITGKSEQEMKEIETYEPEGWYIVNIKIEDYVDQTWYIDDGNDYPRLGWQKP